MAKKVVFEKSVAKDMVEKASLLGKDSRLFVQIGPKSKDGKVGAMLIVVNQPNQYSFGLAVDEPDDFVEGECYMKFACEATRFVNIVSNLLLFDNDVAIAENGGHFFVGGGNKSMVGLDVIAWPADESTVFFDAKAEKIMAAVKKVDLKEFATALMVGGGFDGESDMTRGVSLSFAKNNIIVSSTTGTVAATACSTKLENAEMGAEPTRVCVSDRQLETLRKYTSMSGGDFSVQCGEKHIFLYSKRGNLFLGLSIPGADASGLISGFTAGEYRGTVVFDTEQLSTVLKAYAGVTEEEVALFSMGEQMLTLKARKGAMNVTVPIASKDGDISEFPPCMSIRMLRNALAVLKNGNLVISLYKKPGKDMVMPILSNEKVDGAYNGEILVMPIALDKLEASERELERKEAEKAAKKEKKTSKKAESAEE